MDKAQDMVDRTMDFGRDRIGSLFKKLFFPTLVGMISNSVLTLIDGVFVGRGVGSDGIAAVNIVAPLFLLVTGVGLMLGIGASVIASIRLAEKNTAGACRIMTHAVVVGTALTFLLCLWCLAFPSLTVKVLGSSPALERYAVDYMIGLLPCFLFLFIECVGMMLIRLDGSPRYAMCCQIVAAVFNIGLDYVMVFPLGWGVAGAAIATSISAVVGGLMVLVYFVRYSTNLKFVSMLSGPHGLAGVWRNISHMSKIGFPTLLTEGAMGIMMLTGNYVFMSRLGDDGVAAYAIACYLFPVVFSISNAVAQSAQPIISYNYGAGAFDRVHASLRVALFTAVLCGVIITLGMVAGSGYIVEAFLSTDEAAYGLAVSGLPLFAVCALPFAVNITFIGYYQSVEQVLRPLVYTLLRGIVFLIPAFVLLPHIIGNPGLWFAIPTAEVLTLLVIVAGYAVTLWRHAVRG